MSITLHTKTGPIKIQLLLQSHGSERQAKCVQNFLRHAAKGSYDDCQILRYIPEFILQSGDPSNTGKQSESADGDNPIDKIVKSSEFRPTDDERLVTLQRGSVFSVNNMEHRDSLGSQFFICLSDKHKNALEGQDQYTLIGTVIDGLDSLAQIEQDPELNDPAKAKKSGKPRGRWKKESWITRVEIHNNPFAVS